MVDLILRKGAEEARNQLPDLLTAAEKGRSTIITRHGRPVAALVPIEAYRAAIQQQSLMPLQGSGRGQWRKNSTATTRRLHDEILVHHSKTILNKCCFSFIGPHHL